MTLYLVNYGDIYEIEQLTRMFFRPLDCIKTDRAELAEDTIIVEKDGNVFHLSANANGKSAKADVTVVPGEIKEDLQLCRAAYDMYVSLCGKTLLWGILTGVRPVRLCRNLYKKYNNIQTVKQIFKDRYGVSDEKLRLCEEIFALQKPILENIQPNDFSLYISIPFCPSRCSYCSFVSVSIKSAAHLMGEYTDRLCDEIRYTAKKAAASGMRLRTIYIGGGTPTAISASQLEQVMKTVSECFDLDGVLEYTVEAGRPDCTDIEKLRIIKKYGADRISINPQTFSDDVLKEIGRNHTTRDFIRCVKDAREVGFDCINMDLIAGLPLDTVEGFEKSLRGCIELGAENITVHTLTLKRASNLVIRNEEHEYKNVPRMIAKNAVLADYGYKPYYMYRQKSTVNNLENVGFTQFGHESMYNIYIMEEVQTIISCGAGGVSKVVGDDGDIERVNNYKYPKEYIDNFPAILKRKDEVFRLCREMGVSK